MPFQTEITVTGPMRSPRQMLHDQVTDGHASVHDGDAAASLGLQGAPIEGPTHFSQFDPLAFTLWGPAWFGNGCISSHFQTMVVEGEQVQATMTTTGPASARIGAVKDDGRPVLVGTASVGPEHAVSELEARRAAMGDPGELFIVDRLEIGMTYDGGIVSIDHETGNGPLYPFSLDQKTTLITEPHPWYTAEGGSSSPWGRAIIPFEMASVMSNKSPGIFPVRRPSLGLFLDLQVRMHGTPLFVGHGYHVMHEVVGVGQSRKTESFWTSSTLTDIDTGALTATVLLHQGVFKASYPGYPSSA